MSDENKDLMSQVSGLAPEVAEALTQDHLFQPVYFDYAVETKLKIPGADKMNGTVVMKFPNLGDDLKIERMTRALGGTNVAAMASTLEVCIVKAPSTWYELIPGNQRPTLNLDRLPDDVVLADLFRAFTEWQRSFR